ncbi:MAG: flagellar basal body L-ring protein FlgH [Planctomycetaceae bacterium]|jgi:flagellar L-ring protein precursor FlgH|nr:flagellar basal body L-ring protein FlgH [Planctomycetaceae bacterium]
MFKPIAVLFFTGTFFCISSVYISSVPAQTGSLSGTPALLSRSGKPMKMTEASLTFQAPPRQKVFQIGDIIYVHVKEEMTYNNSANNQRKKNIETEARITYWSKISGFLKLPVSAGAGGTLPEIGGEIDHKTQNQGRMTRKETLELRMPCRVTSIEDNGNLRIEGDKEWQFGEEGSVLYVSGVIRPDTIGQDFSVRSDQISEFAIKNIPSGNVYDTVRRPWGTRLIEQLKPF